MRLTCMRRRGRERNRSSSLLLINAKQHQHSIARAHRLHKLVHAQFRFGLHSPWSAQWISIKWIILILRSLWLHGSELNTNLTRANRASFVPLPQQRLRSDCGEGGVKRRVGKQKQKEFSANSDHTSSDLRWNKRKWTEKPAAERLARLLLFWFAFSWSVQFSEFKPTPRDRERIYLCVYYIESKKYIWLDTKSASKWS